jgi:hypothetical protein
MSNMLLQMGFQGSPERLLDGVAHHNLTRLVEYYASSY